MQLIYIEDLFLKSIKSHCEVLENNSAENLNDGSLYLVVHFEESGFKLVHIPTGSCKRFIEIPGEGHQYVFLDDVVKLNASKLFKGKSVLCAYSIKLSRDAELYLEDDYTNIELVEKIYGSLAKRNSGQPTRLLYDQNMPESLLKEVKEELELGDVDLFPGGTYHNMSDLFGFPNPPDKENLLYEFKPSLKHPELSFTKDIFKSIREKDHLVHFPYQDFSIVENFINSSASDDKVLSIKMSLYRIAKTSSLSDAILQALDNGKKVVLFVEAQARFDEENNINWGRIFREKGATVIFSIPNVKVHSKIALVEREEDGEIKRYAYIGTGNFNAKTSKIYCDHGLLTAHARVTHDLSQVFDVLERKLIIPKLKHLLVSPFSTRNTFLKCIQTEIDNSKQGKLAKITIKMNSLEDSQMIAALYRACEAGVEVRLIVRGFCCFLHKSEDQLLPNEKPAFITSIVDRYLEHGRIYLFENGGEEIMYTGSADWMVRNLDRRIEVLVPILDKAVFKELKDIFMIQLNDNVKARILDGVDSNAKVEPKAGEAEIRSQYAIYDYLENKLNEES